MISSKRKFYLIITLLIIGVVVSVIHYQIMDYGPGTTGDSVVYLEAARNHHDGIGFFDEEKPLIHYPPAYPGVLSLLSYLTKGDVFVSAKVLCAVLFGVNMVLFSIGVLLNTDWNLLAGGSAILFFLFSRQIFMTHSMVWSEALFITFTLTTFFLLSQYLQKPNYRSLLLMAIVAGLAMITRYVGVTLFPPIVISILYFGDRSLNQKMKDSLILVLSASIPLIAWISRNYLLASSSTNRSFAIHLINTSHIENLIKSLHAYVFPFSVTTWHKSIHLLIISAILIAFFIVIQKKDYLNRTSFSHNSISFFSYLIFSIGYIIFLVISISFFDASIPMDARLLLPVSILLSLACISLVWSFSKIQGNKSIWYSFILFILFSVSINSNSAIESAIQLHDSGRGFSSQYWLDSEIIEYLKIDLDNRKVYSNGSDIIRFLSEKEASPLPRKISTRTKKPNDEYNELLIQILAEVNDGTARIIYFTGMDQGELPTIEELEINEKLPIQGEYEDGVIFAIP